MGSGNPTPDPLEGMIEPQSIGYPSKTCVKILSMKGRIFADAIFSHFAIF